MKKLSGLFWAVFLLQVSAFSQSGLYFGGEAGMKFDMYHYVNSKGNDLTMLPVDGVWGGHVGYNYNGFTVETGFYGNYTSTPFFHYDYATNEASRSSSSSGGSGMNSWVIPLRFGKEFLFFQNRLFLKPEMGIIGIFARDYTTDQPNSGWGENVSPFPGFPYFTPSGPDSTRAYSYRAAKSNFGIETAFSFGYRLKEKADIYFKGTYQSSFAPLYYDVITHYSENETVYATSTQTGNAFLFQIGLRYFSAKRD